MNRNKKGWWTGAVPANRVNGKTMQYYVEARGAKEEVAATNGKVDSPNVISLRTAAEGAAAKPASSEVAAKAPAKAAASKTSARRTPAAQKQRGKPRPSASR
jgi:hypothetical protein